MLPSRITSVVILLLALAGVVALQRERPRRPATENVTFAFNERMPSLSAEAARFLTFGYPQVITNLLWLRFLQYTPTEKVPPGQTSWIYHDLDTISTIDPAFSPVFEQGAVFLSVITEDKIGAERLLLKGTKLFPQSWRVWGNLGYHYYFELNDHEKARAAYQEAAKNPDAPWLFTALAMGDTDTPASRAAAVQFLEGMLERDLPEVVRKKMMEQLKELRQAIPKRAPPAQKENR